MNSIEAVRVERSSATTDKRRPDCRRERWSSRRCRFCKMLQGVYYPSEVLRKGFRVRMLLCRTFGELGISETLVMMTCIIGMIPYDIFQIDNSWMLKESVRMTTTFSVWSDEALTNVGWAPAGQELKSVLHRSTHLGTRWHWPDLRSTNEVRETQWHDVKR